MAPRELIVNITKNRMAKLPEYGEHIPIKIKGAGKSGEFHAVMVNPTKKGGMLSAAGVSGGMLTAAGATQHGGKTNWPNVAKKASAVASPLAMLGGPEMLPISAGLAALAGSGKKKKTAKKVKKGVDLAVQIGALLAESQGYQKEAETARAIGKVVKGSGSKSRKAKNTVGDLASIAALLGQTSGYLTPAQAQTANLIGQVVKGSGPQDLTGDVFHPPEAILPPRPRNARPKIAVDGGAAPTKKKILVSQSGRGDVRPTRQIRRQAHEEGHDDRQH